MEQPYGLLLAGMNYCRSNFLRLLRLEHKQAAILRPLRLAQDSWNGTRPGLISAIRPGWKKRKRSPVSLRIDERYSANIRRNPVPELPRSAACSA